MKSGKSENKKKQKYQCDLVHYQKKYTFAIKFTIKLQD